MISVRPDVVRTDPSLPGIEVSPEEWRLDPDHYRPFIEAVTGIDVDPDPTADTCYRIANRLEAFVHEHRQAGTWEPSLTDAYPVVASLDQIVWVARICRACHTDHVAAVAQRSPA